MLTGKILHEAGIVTVRHKADVLTVVLAGVDELVLFGNFPHLGLVQAAQRQPDVRQLLLRQVVEHIALILTFVQTLFEQEPAGGLVLLHPGIVTRDHILHAVGFGPVQQMAELHIFIAVDAGVRGAAGFVARG